MKQSRIPFSTGYKRLGAGRFKSGLQTKALLVPLVLIVLMGVAFATAYLSFDRQRLALTNSFENSQASSLIVTDAYSRVVRSHSEVYRVMSLLSLGVDTDQLSAIGRELSAEMSATRVALQRLVRDFALTDEENRQVAKVIAALQGYDESVQQAIQVAAFGLPMASIFMLGVEREFNSLRAAAERLDEMVSGVQYDVVLAGTAADHLWVILILALVASLGVATTLATMRRIIQPIVEITDSMRQLATGLTDVEPLSIDREDEIGDMARALDVFKHNDQKRRRAEQALSHRATHDALTGLINRVEFERRLERALDTARRSHETHALCYLDLDKFKVVNDTCGHMAGDELLRQLGKLLQSTVRVSDTLARLGGDEFGLLMQHCTLPQANRIADNIRKAVEEFQFVWEEREFRIGVSIGLVPVTESNESVAYFVSAADSACYAAKSEGRNRVHVYQLDDTDLARRQGEMRWVDRIEQALEDNRLQLWSQPIVPIAAGKPGGEHFELLLRLIDERGQIVAPGEFLPAAERYGLSTRIDRWVIGAAFDWLHRNPVLLERLQLCCINLTGTSLASEEILEFVQQQLENFCIPPQKICFEVTEAAAIANLSRAMVFMQALRARGCRFALDDFGSGLSSFACLKTLPVDYLKIDGAFVVDIVDDDVNLALVRSINDVGKVMGKLTIAEFVEDEAILQKLREIGVDYAQGYGIARPTPIAETLLFAAGAN